MNLLTQALAPNSTIPLVPNRTGDAPIPGSGPSGDAFLALVDAAALLIPDAAVADPENHDLPLPLPQPASPQPTTSPPQSACTADRIISPIPPILFFSQDAAAPDTHLPAPAPLGPQGDHPDGAKKPHHFATSPDPVPQDPVPVPEPSPQVAPDPADEPGPIRDALPLPRQSTDANVDAPQDAYSLTAVAQFSPNVVASAAPQPDDAPAQSAAGPDPRQPAPKKSDPSLTPLPAANSTPTQPDATPTQAPSDPLASHPEPSEAVKVPAPTVMDISPFQARIDPEFWRVQPPPPSIAATLAAQTPAPALPSDLPAKADTSPVAAIDLTSLKEVEAPAPTVIAEQIRLPASGAAILTPQVAQPSNQPDSDARPDVLHQPTDPAILTRQPSAPVRQSPPVQFAALSPLDPAAPDLSPATTMETLEPAAQPTSMLLARTKPPIPQRPDRLTPARSANPTPDPAHFIPSQDLPQTQDEPTPPR